MSTAWVPLSMITPPPATSGSAFHRWDMSTREAKATSTRTTSPRTPSRINSRAWMTSLTKRNFEAMVNGVPVRAATASTRRAL